MKRLSLVALTCLLSACTSITADHTARLGDLPSEPLRILPNSNIAVDHDEVLNRYLAYLEVAQEPELRIRVAHRMAALKLQHEEQLADAGLESAASHSEKHNALAAISDYEELLRLYPDRRDNDALLYQLAKAYVLVGKPMLAITTLERLTQDFAKSDYYLESEFRLGQLLYASGDYAEAAKAYERLIAKGRDGNDYYVSAGYLLGWSLFKQQLNEQSLAAFVRVLDEEFVDETALEQATGGNLELRDDILRIMAVTFAEMGDWDQIEKFFASHGARFYEYRLYDRLASLYYEREFHRSAASTLRAFVLRYPLDKRSPSFYERLIEGYKKARYPELMRRHKEYYVALFGVGTAYWQAHPELHEALTHSLGTYIWDMASFFHAWGQNTQVAQDHNARLKQAERWYNEYIRSFPEAQDTVKAHFFNAEIAFELGDFPTAKEHYEIVAYQYPQYEKAVEAGYAAILAYNKYQPSAQEAKVWRAATVASAMRFVQEYPQDPRSGVVLVNTAEMLLKDQYYPQALSTSRLAAKIEQDLSPRYRYGAALVRGHSAFELGFYAEAESAIELALAQRQADSKTYKDLREKMAASIYRQGEQSKEQGDSVAAVAHWRRLAKVVPESDTRILAEYDAATLLMTSADYAQAVEVMLQFRKDYPGHKLNADIPSKLIVAYEQQGQWQAAALELKQMWQTSKNTEEQRIACYQAAQYFAKAEDYENALDMFRNYANNYSMPFDAAVEAHYQLDQLYAKLNNEEKRRFWLNKIISLHNDAGQNQSDRSRYLAASAAFQLGEFERLQFEQVKISLPLDKSITKKNGFLQAAQKRYTQAVQLGVLEFTTSSTYHLGQLYAQMSQALLQSERPAGMSDVEQEEYQFLLEEQAFPLDEAAISVYQTNTQRTRDGLYDEWIKKTFTELARLMPAQYNKSEKVLSYVENIR